MELIDTRGRVETPERVAFRYQLAGPGRRAAAWGVDLIGRGLILILLAVLVALTGWFGWSAIEAASGVFLIAVFTTVWIYPIFFEIVLAGRTPGKLLFGLRVVREDGSPARPPDLVLRNLARAVDLLPFLFGVGLLSILLDRKMRRIGDLVGGTVVIVEERSRMGSDFVVEPLVTEEERQTLPARVMLSPREITIIEDFLRRRKKFAPARIEELAALCGPQIGQRTGIEADSWERVLLLAYARATGRDR